jgi:hypothetical protein
MMQKELLSKKLKETGYKAETQGTSFLGKE